MAYTPLRPTQFNHNGGLEPSQTTPLTKLAQQIGSSGPQGGGATGHGLSAGLSGFSAGIGAGTATADPTQGALQGAAQGAAAGATFGVAGALIGGAAGLLGGYFQGRGAYNKQVDRHNAMVEQVRAQRRAASADLIHQRSQLRQVVSQNLKALTQNRESEEAEALQGTVFRGFSSSSDYAADDASVVAQGYVTAAMQRQQMTEDNFARRKQQLDYEGDLKRKKRKEKKVRFKIGGYKIRW